MNDEETPAAPERDLTTRDAILAVNARQIRRVYIAPWKGHVYVRTISGAQRDAFEAAILKERMDDGGKVVREVSTENVRAKLVALCLCDKDGNAIFTEADVTALGDMDAAGLTLCYNEASALNRVSDADVDELAKNSGREATATS